MFISNKFVAFLSVQALVVERADAENLGSHTDQASTTDSDLTPEDKNFHPRSARPVRRQQVGQLTPLVIMPQTAPV